MRRNDESGQVAVETAIVLPLFVFMLLGILQLGLMHQARLLTKYAAYKAVRAGSLHNADVGAMERAAVAVLLPMASQAANSGGAEVIKPVNDASSFRDKWESGFKDNQMPDADLKFAEVTICGPLKGDVSSGVTQSGKEMDFDNPKAAVGGGSWDDSLRTKLRVQVTFNYRLPIPFADVVIYNIARGLEIPWVLRLGKTSSRREFVNGRMSAYDSAAGNKIYILPIRATYNMRMHSNFYLTQKALPEDNQCIFPF
ncbi:TadE/TadG family type IV pilus assembly protein [Corallococcus aberystwythensis]|uniref:Pilus assembly protein n=1 Tax=Corallococcus aberystwythensis TaxID=2316722 RepID=A0A3A8PJI6_9BACT|nr:TadE family protein [Corallococcus aberystwythensis]RKH56448.1 pilus assembly protein [Corallococcus aberystwythensis]